MRIRTEDEYAYRGSVIEEAADFWGCNKTDAVVKSCDFAGRVLPQLKDALEAADIPPSETRKVVEAVSTPNVTVEFERPTVLIERTD